MPQTQTRVLMQTRASNSCPQLKTHMPYAVLVKLKLVSSCPRVQVRVLFGFNSMVIKLWFHSNALQTQRDIDVSNSNSILNSVLRKSLFSKQLKLSVF